MKAVTNATIPTGNGNEAADVHIFIEGGKIVDIVPSSSPISQHQVLFDANGMLVLPGCIDPHVHFNTPGYEDHEDFEHGSMAAAAGGVTTVIDMPDTCVPSVVSLENLGKKLKALEGRSVVDYALWGGISGNSFRNDGWREEIKKLWYAGVVGFKSYFLSGMDAFEALNLKEWGEVLSLVSELGGLVGLHAEDPRLVEKNLRSKSSSVNLQDYYVSRADPVEERAVDEALKISKKFKTKLHIVHLASGWAMQSIAVAKREKLDVTAETCPHYLAFTHEDFDRIGPSLKCAPVVKTAHDREMLWLGLEDRTIDFVATDHAPCTAEEKNRTDIWEIYNGMPGVEWSLPYLFSEGYLKNRISLARLVEITSTAAAKRFGLYPWKGTLSVGCDADLAVFNPYEEWVVRGGEGCSKGKLTPFEGFQFKGRNIVTILRGEVVYSNGKFPMGFQYGRWFKRG